MAWQAALAAGASKIVDRHFARQDVKRGFSLENKYGMKRERLMWLRAQSRGLTPQEYYGSPASGGSFPSGGAQTLGNASMQSTPLFMEMMNREKDRAMIGRGQDIELQKTQIQADAAKYSADQTSGATREAAQTNAMASLYASQIQELVANNRLRFDEKQYREIHLPGARQNLELTKAQTQKAINEIATSDAKFVSAIKMLTMGTENMVATLIAKEAGIDLADPKTFTSMDKEKRKAVISAMIGAGGHSRKEIEGLFQLIEGNVGTIGDRPPSLGAGNSEKDWETIFDKPWLKIRKQK